MLCESLHADHVSRLGIGYRHVKLIHYVVSQKDHCRVALMHYIANITWRLGSSCHRPIRNSAYRNYKLPSYDKVVTAP